MTYPNFSLRNACQFLASLLIITPFVWGEDRTENHPRARVERGKKFVEVTSSGLPIKCRSNTLALGDYNGDGFDDLIVSGCRPLPFLWKNNGDNTFSKIALKVERLSDCHGMGFADFDNDGDQDLLQTTGGRGGKGGIPGGFLVNYGDHFKHEAVARGIDYLDARGRMPLWLDYDNDGLLDLLYCNAGSEVAWTRLFKQKPDHTFMPATGAFDLEANKLCDSQQFRALYSHLFDDQKPCIVLPMDRLALEIGESGLKKIDLPPLRGGRHIAIADLDNDGKLDMAILRGPPMTKIVETPNGFRLQARTKQSFQALHFSVQGSDEIKVFIRPAHGVKVFNREQVFIGDYKGEWFNPPADQWPPPPPTKGIRRGEIEKVYFTLSKKDPRTHMEEGLGRMNEYPLGNGVYIFYNPAKEEWELSIAAGSPSSSGNNPFGRTAVGIFVKSKGRISITERIRFGKNRSNSLRIFRNTGQDFIDVTSEVLGDFPHSGNDIVAADFDNDGDQDLYIVCCDTLENKPNIILENKDGRFTLMADIADAAGSMLGRGDQALVADYNKDGRLDLVVTNGWGNRVINSGPLQYIRNNIDIKNNWLAVNLVGDPNGNGKVNRDAIGAIVKVVTPDGNRQIRELGCSSQASKRLHFGLGENSQIQQLCVLWPNGAHACFDDVDVNREVGITQINEGAVLEDMLRD